MGLGDWVDMVEGLEGGDAETAELCILEHARVSSLQRDLRKVGEDRRVESVDTVMDACV